MTNAQPLARGIANKGFSGMRSILTRLKVQCNLIGESPAIPYCGHTATVRQNSKNLLSEFSSKNYNICLN